MYLQLVLVLVTSSYKEFEAYRDRDRSHGCTQNSSRQSQLGNNFRSAAVRRPLCLTCNVFYRPGALLYNEEFGDVSSRNFR